MTRARKATGHQCVPTSIAGLAEGADYVGQLSRCVKCGVYEAPVSVSLLDDSTWMTARGRDPFALRVDAHPTCEGDTTRMAAIVAIRRMRNLLNELALSVEPHYPDRHARLIARRDGLDAILRELDTLWPAEVSP